jgi:hypothetical protein
MYNLEYYYKMLRNNSSTAELISSIRWKFIEQTHPRTVLDYGAGVGFFAAFKPDGIEVDTFDIGPFPQSGIKHNHYTVVTFWDVLEHMPNFHEVRMYFTITDYVAFSVPLLTPEIDLKTWRHFKPEEHLKLFTEEQLDALFNYYGFTKVKSAYVECPPRKDVKSFLYKRNGDSICLEK